MKNVHLMHLLQHSHQKTDHSKDKDMKNRDKELWLTHPFLLEPTEQILNGCRNLEGSQFMLAVRQKTVKVSWFVEYKRGGNTIVTILYLPGYSLIAIRSLSSSKAFWQLHLRHAKSNNNSNGETVHPCQVQQTNPQKMRKCSLYGPKQ